MSGFKLDDYVDVAERIRLFYERYPDGSLKTGTPPKPMQIGERWFMVYHARAYRFEEDKNPADGWAWEPIPGPTPYTKDSELMNAETSAWGRAIIAAGIPSKKIASAEEVRNRRDDGSGADSGEASARHSSPASDRPSRRTIPENLAYLDELLKTLHEMDGTIVWRESAANVAARFFGERDFTKLKAAELQSVVDEVERWAAGRQPQETPFS